MQFGDVVNLGGGLENFKGKRFELVILAFKECFRLEQADIDSVFFKEVKHLHQNNCRNDDGAFTFIGGLESLMAPIVDNLFTHHEFYKGLRVGHKAIHYSAPDQGASKSAP